MKKKTAKHGEIQAEPAGFEQFREKLGQMVARFDHNLSQYKSAAYDEASLRQEFLNPFFRALGWDMENEAGLIPQHREVETESRTEIAGRQKRADYLFRTDRQDRFVCEAKKPAEELHARYAFQSKRYAWNKGLVLAVLSDFEDMKIYVVGSRPHPDEADAGLWKAWNFRKYPEAAREMWDLLSRNAVAAGSIDKLVDSLPRKPVAKGKARQQWLFKPDRTRSLDVDFLNFLDEARRSLASDLLRCNDRADLLEGTRLDEAVQRILDRLLFLRICEDRDIDTGRPLANVLWLWRSKSGQEPQTRRVREAELPLYEPGASASESTLSDPPAAYRARNTAGAPLWREVVALFRALDRRPPSHIPFFNGNLFKPHFSEELEVSDEWIAGILDEIGDEESPYLFNVIPVEILGTIYERFLGKTIRPKGRGVIIEEKPEVRKAGGVYYTPRYIVDYIVEQTVGNLLAERTPKESLALRILDPACGSGSFLIRAFERICEHWQAAMMKDPKQRRKQDCWTDPETGDVHLTSDLKRRILTANIYGVDLDAGAVEVTQLSLYLKMLEGENRTTLSRERDLFGSDTPLLPPLQENIKCGNSLISSDFSLDPDDLTRVRAFDWDEGFRDILKTGGFDAVVGNPPYIFTRNQGIAEEEKEYYHRKFKYQSIQLNTFGIFVEKAYLLLKPNGHLGFITPNNWLTIDTFMPLRRFMLQSTSNLKVTNILDRVFEAADVDTCVVMFRKGKPDSIIVAEMSKEREIYNRSLSFDIIQPPSFIIQIGLLKDSASQALLSKIDRRSEPLSAYATVSTGLKAYQTGKGKPQQTDKQKEGRVFHSSTKRDASYAKYLDGVDVCRYVLGWSGEWLSYGDWLAEPRRSVPFNGDRILVRQIPASPPYLVHGVFTSGHFYNDINSMVVFAPSRDASLKYLLGAINSRLVSFWFEKKFDKLQRKIFPQFKVKELADFPIPKINLSTPSDRTRHDKLVSLVDKMLALVPKLRSARSETDRSTLQNAIASTDRQIDTLVYDLYGLTSEEIALVEGIRA